MINGSFKISNSPVPLSFYLGKENAFSQRRLADLISAVESFQGAKKILALVSAYMGEGASEIGFELAMALSSSGKRILIIDSNPSDQGVFKEMRYRLPVSINSAIHATSNEVCPVLQVSGTNVSYTSFCKNEQDQAIVQNAERLEELLSTFREGFDFIFMIAESHASIAAAKVAQLADASIIVIEAERTRRPVVAQMIDTIKSNGGAILGLVLNKRPLYIPQMIYSLLYK